MIGGRRVRPRGRGKAAQLTLRSLRTVQLPLDFGEVNVVYTATNGTEYLVYYVANPSQCTDDGGWFYDVDPAVGTPTRILLCPQSCQFVQDFSGKIDIEIGCVTRTPPK